MTQTTTGVRAVLNNPAIYELLQRLMGARATRERDAREVIKARLGDRILDIGCARADILSYLPKGVFYTGLDISAAYIDAAKRKFGERGRFICARLESNTLPDERFDIILMWGVLHHMDDDEAEYTLSELGKRLSPNGRIVTCDPVLVENQNRIARLLISMDRGHHVRTKDGYLKLSRLRSTVTIRSISFPPYTHAIMECSK